MGVDELKDRHRVAWGAAPFERIEETIAGMHDDLVGRLEPGRGVRWLDVGCGTGAVPIRAARAGADVTALDLSDVLVETARRRAQEEGLAIRCDVGDAERLPVEDAAFDVVSSSVGAIFAPDHRAVASELARVTRPGGRLGLTAWRAGGAIGDFFRLVARFQPPPPEGAGNPLQWGDDDYVSQLLGDDFELDFHEGNVPLIKESGEAVWELMLAGFGPLRVLYDSLDPECGEELHREFVDFHERYRHGEGIHQPRIYVTVVGTRRS